MRPSEVKAKLITKNEKHHIWGASPVNCDEDDTESIRAEKSVVLALLTILSIIEDLASTINIPIPVYCNNSEAVSVKQQLAHLKSYICFVETNADLDAEIQAALRKIRATINLIHIKGHQDDEKG